jgi:hypothetical protein
MKANPAEGKLGMPPAGKKCCGVFKLGRDSISIDRHTNHIPRHQTQHWTRYA